MSSILKVDSIQNQSGNNIINKVSTSMTIGASGDTILIPSGSTLSVQGTYSQSGPANFTGAFTITTTDNSDTLTLISTDADANVGPNLILQRDSGSPADGDSIGRIDFDADNDAGQVTSFFSIRGEIEDASDGTEDGQLKIDQMIGGTTATILRFKSTETVFNDDSKDVDFRVESNGNANMLFVDGGNDRVGIGTASPSTKLTINEGGEPSADGMLLLQANSSSRQLRISPPSNASNGKIDYRGGNLTFQDDGTEVARFQGTTGFGIGVSAPTTRLDVDLSGTGETVPIVLSNRNTTAGTGQKTTLGFGLARNSGAFKSQAGTIEVGREQDWTSADTNIDSYMAFSTYLNNAGTEKMRVTAGGFVGIGTTAPAANLHVDTSNSGVTPNANADELFVENSGNAGITIGTGTSGAGQLCFGDSGDNDIGTLAYLHDVNAMRFTTSGIEAMRIDSSGNLLVGKTAIAFATVGAELRENGQITGTRDGNASLILNRLNSDGEIAKFYKDGTQVSSFGVESGSLSVRRPTGTNGLIQTFGQPTHGIVGAIGNTSVDFYITNNSSGSNNAGLLLSNSNKVVPMENASNSDNVTDLGSTTARFKDIYLGGGAFIGGTGTANKLDDYEEGTWSGTISDGTNNATMGSNTGSYIKIGSLVFISGYFTVSSLGSASGNLRLTGLPFANGSSNDHYTANGGGWGANLSITDDTSIGFQLDTNASHINISNWDNTSGTTPLQASELSANGQFMLNLTYRTDA